MRVLNLINDFPLDVALANSRKALKWKNQQLAWSTIVDRMSATVRTPETVAEYRKMSKDQQADIKDVGAFVGGYCIEGSRSNIRHRSILALDADYAQAGLWDDWSLAYGNAAVIYSTHKHTPENPRLRLVVPLSRNVNPDEFQAIGRRVAADLGIDQFDDTTYQPQRCMFWPSTSRDGDYVFDYLDGPALDADAVLGTYYDWRDISAWPMSSRVSEIVKKSAAKQADPLTKDGLVGAFCRVYSIEDAIAEFVPDYAPCDDPGRYTYTPGSSAAGVTVYDGKFSFSFHATDPASGVLCNAWDLVRLHKFGELDADRDSDKSESSRPSWKAMQELAMNDARVKAQIVADRTAEAVADFDAPADEDTNWAAGLDIAKSGELMSTIKNFVLILENDTELSGCLAYDEMSHNIVNTRHLPWRAELGVWSDADDSALRFFIEKKYKVSGKDKIFDAVNVTAMQHTFHPVRDYLEACTWDGVPRVETLLVDFLGAADTAYTRAVTRKTLVAAVARVFNPGVKFDYMLTLRGRQGLGKSGLIAKLGGRWFSDSFTTLQGKDAFEQLQGVWIMEIGELAGMRKAEAETIKLFISKQTDRFRPAYGRRQQEFPRQCIFVGTTNETAFLRDSTGNRRFWVVDTPDKPLHDIWSELTPEVVAQVWGEAVAIYKAGEALYLPRALEAAAREVQAAFEEENPKTGIISAYLDRGVPAGWDDMDLYQRRQWLEGSEIGSPREYVCVYEIVAEALGGNPDRIDRYAINEVTNIMAGLPGWVRQGASMKTFKPYGRQKFYRRVIDE